LKTFKYRFWAWPWELRRLAILGINARNLDYLLPLNPRSSYHYVDDKIATKQICQEQRIPVPELYAVIDRFGDLRKLPEILGPRKEFVVKPARGAGGRGVWVISNQDNNFFYTPQNQRVTFEEMRYHISTILSGLFSLEGQLDRVIIEQRIVPHPVFAPLLVSGTPDIRIILYRHSPVMAMVRLPTRESKGRANLHQGAVASGINLQTGVTCGGVYKNKMTDIHPDTGVALSGIIIPNWDRVLEIAIQFGRVVDLQYLGIDIILDNNHGSVILEANARPGLAIQIANGCGLIKQIVNN